MNNFRIEHRFSDRVLAFILVIMMLFTSVPESVISASAADDEFAISIKWSHEASDQYNYTYDSNSPEIRDIHLQVAFSNKQVSEAYAPGELIITVPGIRGAVRSGNSYIASSVAADKEGSGRKVYNWSYSYTEATDTYTFTNNFTVEKQSVFEGTFEIVWSLPSRETIDYLKDLPIQAEMFIPGKGENSSAKTIQSNKIYYSQTRVKDEYKLNITHTSIKGIKKSDDENYLKVVYDISCADNYKSKDVATDELFEFWFLEDATVSGGGLVETDETKSDFDGDENTYKKYTYVKNITNTNPLSLKDIVVVYPGKYNGQEVTVYGYAYGKYYEEEEKYKNPPESERGEELTHADYKVALDNYNYEDIPGDVYDVTKESYGIHNMTIDQKYAKYGAIDSANLTDGKGDYYSDLKIRLKFHDDRGYTSHDLEFVDDILDVNMKNGDIQQLTDDEYHFTKLRIPPKSEILNDKNQPITGDYSIEIKGRRANSTAGEFNVDLGTCTLSDKEQIIDIEENDIVGVSVRFKGVKENIGYLYNPNTSQTMVRCYYAFHMKKENAENVLLDGGHVINNMFFRLYNNEGGESEWVNKGYALESGEYTDEREYERDKEIYGEGVDREKANTPIVEIPNEFSIRQVKLEAMEEDGNAYHFNGLIEGNFNLGDGTGLENFSMYMIVPEGLRIEEMYNNPDNLLSKLKFSASNGMTSAYIASHVKIEIHQDEKYNGRQYIQFDFDFSDDPIQIETLMINGVPMYADKNEFESGKSYNYTLHGALLVNQGGKWNSRHTDSYAINGDNDIDGDGNTEEPADFASHNIRFTYAEETFVELKKYVKTPLTNGLVSPNLDEGDAAPKTYAGGDYSYILKAGVSKDAEESSGATNIIFADVIESKTQDKSEWQGEFVDIDYSKALAQLTYSGSTKPAPTIYYSTEEFVFKQEDGVGGAKHNKFNRETFTSSDKWTTEKPTDAKQIRSVAVDFGEGVAKPGTTLQIEIKMKAPESSENFNKIAKNKCSISYEKINASGERTEEHLDSNIVPVTYVAKGKIVLTKKDATDHSAITGATFELYKSSGDKVGEYTVDQNGRLVVNDLEYGKYYFKETEAPKGYELGSTKQYEVTVDEKVANITVENERKKGTFTIKKVSDRQPTVTLQGAVFKLYKADGTPANNTEYTTNADGTLTVNNLDWGSYYLKETKAPDGYKISDKKIEFTINADNDAGAELETVTVENEQIPAKAKLVKYELKNPYGEATSDAELNEDKPLKGAVYALYKEGDDGNPITRKVTDKNGEIYVEDLTFGKYYFQELSAPAGYELYTGKITFTVGAEDTTEKIKTVVKTADSRKTATVSLTKTAAGTGDAIHAADKVGNAVYRLYFSTDTAFANPLKVHSEGNGKYSYKTTGETTDMITEETEGFIEISGLPWNSETDSDEKYVLKEYKAPTGYDVSKEEFKFRVDANSVSKPFILEDKDEQKKGTVKLVKTDSTGKSMEGVVFTLYREDGSVYQDDIKTGTDGSVTVDNIPWGSYYFLEKAATDAGLNDKKFRFVVNQVNAGKTQEIQIEDPVESFQFTVTKKIKKSDIVFEHGTPTFIFEAKNTTDNHIYRKAVAFNEGSLEEIDGYVTASVIFVVPTGTYEVSEVSVNRYAFKGITVKPDETGVTVDNPNKKVTFTLNNDTKNIEFIFENQKIDQSGTSDSGLITNTLNKDRTLISISAEYHGKEILTEDVIPPEDVTVYAFYDNGTQEELKPDAGYTIGPVDAGKPNTDQSVEVSYTEGTTTRTDFITVKTGNLNVFEYTVTNPTPIDGYDGEITIWQYKGNASVVKFPASLTVTEGGVNKTYKVKEVAAKVDDWGYPSPNIFSKPNDVTSISFAEGIEEIGTGTFRDAYVLKNISLSASIKKIGDKAFYYKGESLTIPENSQLEEIGEGAFSYTKLSGELKLPASLKTIGKEAFKNCSSLTSLEFAHDSQLVKIGESSFSSCTGLSGDLTIPKSVKTIESQAFESAYTSAGTLRFEDGSALATINNYAFGSCEFATVNFGKQGTQELTIGQYAFQYCEMKDLTLSDNVTTIDNGAFNQCANLESLKIPNSVKTIGDNAFKGCSKLKTLTFEDSTENPSKLTSIGNDAFYNGEWGAKSSDFLTCELNLPASLQKIGDSAFRCANITKLTFNGDNLTEIGDNTFSYCKKLTGDLKIPDSVTTIAHSAFEACSGISNIVVSKNLTTLGVTAFKNCTGYTSIVLPKTLTTVGNGVFQGFKNTGHIYAPNSLSYENKDNLQSWIGMSNIVFYDDYDDLKEKLKGNGDSFPRRLGIML